MKARVVAVDVGSVKDKPKFAWAGLDLDPSKGRLSAGSGTDPEAAADAVATALADGLPVALGFEAPIVLPVSPTDSGDGWKSLGQARRGETVDGRSRPWSAGAGCGALATGLAQMAWILERVGSKAQQVVCTTQPELWSPHRANLLVWEAFVSGSDKPDSLGEPSKENKKGKKNKQGNPHIADAEAAAHTFAGFFEAKDLAKSDVVCVDSAFNLAAAAALYAGLAISVDELRLMAHVYRTQGAKAAQ